jgi:dihydroflavonol-4-reductase
MRTLVTGATGFIGRPLVRRLVERGDEVRVLARPTSNLAALDGLQVEVVRGDVTQPETLPAALAGVQKVFHAAGYISFARKDWPSQHRLNVEGTRNVLAAAERAGVERVIFTSSISALRYSRRPEPATEETPYRDFGIGYARSKRRAEDVALDFHRRGLPVVVLNPTTAMGPDEPVVNSTLPVAKYLRGDLKVRVEGGFNLIHAEDFAAGHVLADERGRPGERYILGGTNLTWAEFFGILDELTGLGMPKQIPGPVAVALAALEELVIAPAGRKPPKFLLDEVKTGTLYRFADASKATRELGLPRHEPREILRQTVDWLRRTGAGGVPVPA